MSETKTKRFHRYKPESFGVRWARIMEDLAHRDHRLWRESWEWQANKIRFAPEAK